MAKTNFETNATEVYEKFIKLNTREMGRALKTGVRKGLLFMRNQARKRFRIFFPSGTIRNPKYTDSLMEGIRATKVKDDKKDGVKGFVLITSNRRPGSGSYRLIFLEGGTVNRYTKKGYNRGSIKASFFFTTTVDENENAYKERVISELDKAVDKINKANLK